MKIYLATDHAGYEFKNEIKQKLLNAGHDVKDCGAITLDPNDDYPDFIKLAAKAVSDNPNSRGIIFGGSGQAENMLANKFKNVRSALFYSKAIPQGAADINGRASNDPFEMVRLAREHNNANILSLGVRFLTIEDAFHAVETFLNTDFLNEERHTRRIGKITQIENE